MTFYHFKTTLIIISNNVIILQYLCQQILCPFVIHAWIKENRNINFCNCSFDVPQQIISFLGIQHSCHNLPLERFFTKNVKKYNKVSCINYINYYYKEGLDFNTTLNFCTLTQGFVLLKSLKDRFQSPLVVYHGLLLQLKSSLLELIPFLLSFLFSLLILLWLSSPLLLHRQDPCTRPKWILIIH